MIILDIETTGTDPRRHCMLSLGAVDYDTGAEFYGECSIYPESEVDPEAMAVNGMDIAKHQPGLLLPAHFLGYDFAQWAREKNGFANNIMLAGHNIGHFDILFLEYYHCKNFIGKFPFSFRTVDLHSVAFAILGKSLKHSDICRELGLQPEPKPHNALNGARSERDCFRELFAIQREGGIIKRYTLTTRRGEVRIAPSVIANISAEDMQAVAEHFAKNPAAVTSAPLEPPIAEAEQSAHAEFFGHEPIAEQHAIQFELITKQARYADERLDPAKVQGLSAVLAMYGLRHLAKAVLANIPIAGGAESWIEGIAKVQSCEQIAELERQAAHPDWSWNKPAACLCLVCGRVHTIGVCPKKLSHPL